MSLYQKPPPLKLMEGSIVAVDGRSSGNPRYTVALSEANQPFPVRVYAFGSPQGYHQGATAQYDIGQEVLVQNMGGTMSIVGLVPSERNPNAPIDLFPTPVVSASPSIDRVQIEPDSMLLSGAGHKIQMGDLGATPGGVPRYGMEAVGENPSNPNIYSKLHLSSDELALGSQRVELTDVIEPGSTNQAQGLMYFKQPRATGNSNDDFHRFVLRPFAGYDRGVLNVPVQINGSVDVNVRLNVSRGVGGVVTGVSVASATATPNLTGTFDLNEYFDPNHFFTFSHWIGAHDSVTTRSIATTSLIDAPTITNSYMIGNPSAPTRRYEVSLPSNLRRSGAFLRIYENTARFIVPARQPPGSPLRQLEFLWLTGVNLPLGGTSYVNQPALPTTGAMTIDVVPTDALTAEMTLFSFVAGQPHGNNGPAFVSSAAQKVSMLTSTGHYRYGDVQVFDFPGQAGTYQVSDRPDIFLGSTSYQNTAYVDEVRIIYARAVAVDAAGNPLTFQTDPPFITAVVTYASIWLPYLPANTFPPYVVDAVPSWP